MGMGVKMVVRLSDYNPFSEQASQERYVAGAQGSSRHTHSDGGELSQTPGNSPGERRQTAPKLLPSPLPTPAGARSVMTLIGARCRAGKAISPLPF